MTTETASMFKVMRRWWRTGYGLILAAVLVASLFAAVRNAESLFRAAIDLLRDEFFRGLPILLGLYALFSLLEHVLSPAGPRKPLKGYWLNLRVLLLASSLGSILVALVAVLSAKLSSHYDLGWIDLSFSTGSGIDAVLGALLAVFIYDFFFYWLHRFQHESFWWQEHKLHHMDEQLCAFSRESWLEPLLSGLLTFIPMSILFKLNPEQGMIAGLTIVVWNTFIHSNIRIHFGSLAVLFNGPQGHRIHHSREYAHHDKNYAAFFPIWDVLFGTYHYPRRDEYPLTGVHDEKEVANFREAAALPFLGWWRMFRAWRSSRVFVATVIKNP